jgi:hypothetical protein
MTAPIDNASARQRLGGRRPFLVGASTGTTELQGSTLPRLKLKLPN